MGRQGIKDQAFTNLLEPIGSDAGRADQDERRERIAEINRMAARKIYVPFSTDMKQRAAAIELRTQGKNLVSGMPGQVPDFFELGCPLQLVEEDGEYVVRPVPF